MITRQQKIEIVAELVEKFKKATGVYLIDFQGMKVEDAIRIRREFKKEEIDMKVAKNSMIKRAMQGTVEYEFPDENLTGQTAVIFSYDDPVTPARIIKAQVDKHKMPVLKAAVIETQVFDGAQLKQLAALPNKQDMMGSIVGSINAPISGIVGSVNAVLRDLAYLVEEVAKKQAS